MGRRSVRDEMQKLVTRYKRSGKSRTEFGEEHGISVSKLSYWVNYFNREAKTQCRNRRLCSFEGNE
jgi:hypothetical protein